MAVSGPQDQVSQAVTIDVARAGNAIAAQVAFALAIDHKAAVTISHRRQFDGVTRGLAKDHIAATCLVSVGGRRVPGSAHHHIGQAVAVDIAHTGDIVATTVTRGFPVNHKADCQRALDIGRKNMPARAFAKHNVAATSSFACRGRAVGRADNHVGKTVTVNVARTCDAVAAVLTQALSDDHKTTRQSGNIRQLNWAIG